MKSLDRAVEKVTEASVKEENQEHDEAVKCYIEAIDYFRHAIRYEACTEKNKVQPEIEMFWLYRQS